MPADDATTDPQPHELHRSFGLLQATAMNTSNMVGLGPFLTIPLILASMGGPQALLGWLIGAAIAICDGMVWAELSSAIPTSGGSFEYLKVAFANTRLGRLLPFLFIWQFIFSGPLEIATGYIGFAQYATYLVPMDAMTVKWLAVAVGVLTVLMLYRKIESVGRLMVLLWAGMVVTIGVVLVSGMWNFDAHAAFDFQPNAFAMSQKFWVGLGAATTWALYDFCGYYSVCYIGDEVRNPARTIPRSILISVITIAVVYIAMNLSIISVVPWADAIKSQYIASDFIEKLYGPGFAVVMTVLLCWTALASVFALMLGYSRIPYAAARDGFFFSVFTRLHPRGDFPHISLLVLGAVACVASFFSLEEVISTMLIMRILVQFIGQIAAVALLRRRGFPNPGFRMALYPLPSLVALAGWLFIFCTAGLNYIAAGLGTLVVGTGVYFVWSARHPPEQHG